MIRIKINFQIEKVFNVSKLKVYPFFCVFVALLVLICVPSQAAEISRIELKPRPGATMEVLMIEPKNPSAAVILMEGGPGHSRVINSGRGFLSGTKEDFAEKGFIVAMPIAPSDQTDFRNGMTPDHRASGEHLQDINSVISFLKKKSNIPVWVVGVSLGTISAANYGINGNPPAAGIVLTSPITGPVRATSSDVDITRTALNKIKIPLLVVGHEDDGCPGTPSAGAKDIAGAATSSRNAKVLIVSGGKDEGQNPCAPLTPHTFYGVEDEVVSAIADFIKSNSK